MNRIARFLLVAVGVLALALGIAAAPSKAAAQADTYRYICNSKYTEPVGASYYIELDGVTDVRVVYRAKCDYLLDNGGTGRVVIHSYAGWKVRGLPNGTYGSCQTMRVSNPGTNPGGYAYQGYLRSNCTN